ncbi:MAG: RpiB/LacA/LacB family sugar-phosphate isomerase [Candidatus Neomarinimicrobiota bacterium]
MKIHLGADHAGFELKAALNIFLKEKGHVVTDHGAFEYDPLDDYPDFIFPCARAVAEDSSSRGIILGGSGQGEAMAANRVPGIRAAVYYNGPQEIVILSRKHNDANILSLGARFLSQDKIFQVIEIWLLEPYEGGRHQSRIKKLDRNN